jgi:hypothetical protein
MSHEEIPWVTLVGNRRILVIPASLEFLGDSIRDLAFDSVEFARGSKLRAIDMAAFHRTVGLASICVPASVESISQTSLPVLLGDPFLTLENLTFESGSKLQKICTAAFRLASNVRSVCLPASLQEIGSEAFMDCRSLSRVTFESGSELRRIEASAFYGCRALDALCFPSTVEFVGPSCFYDCVNLSTLIFETPSRLQELSSLPNGSLRSVTIPDSVEVLAVYMIGQSRPLVIDFGEGSKLQRCELYLPEQCLQRLIPYATAEVGAFLRMPAHRLKQLRRDQEFRNSPFWDPSLVFSQ